MTEEIAVGDRILSGTEKATVRYVGQVSGTKGEWIGVEWDDPNRGKHDGSHNGERYFTTSSGPTAGSFVRAHKIDRGICLAEGVRRRYGEVKGETAGVDEDQLDRLRKEFNAPFVQVVGFDKVNKQQSDFAKLRIVSLKNNGIFGLGKELDVGEWMPNVRELDLSQNLIKNWKDVANIGTKLQKLRVLNVSGNKIPLEPSDLESIREAFASNLKQLVMNEMKYSWKEISQIASAIPNLQILHISNNNITEIDSIPPGLLANLKELDISENNLGDWNNILRFGDLKNLEILNVNTCGIKKIHFEENNLFPSLKFLQIIENAIDSWESIAKLNCLPITDLRVRSNPIMSTEKGETCRQIIIASIKSLKVLNGTEIFKTERYGAELDYRKKFGLEYLQLIKEGKDLGPFYQKFPRYKEFIDLFGAPEDYELVTNVDTSIKSNLIQVNVKCPDDPNFETKSKKIPRNMTVHKLRTLLQRLVKVKGHDLVLSYRSKDDPNVEVSLDNDLRELCFYSMIDGDTILVKW